MTLRNRILAFVVAPIVLVLVVVLVISEVVSNRHEEERIVQRANGLQSTASLHFNNAQNKLVEAARLLRPKLDTLPIGNQATEDRIMAALMMMIALGNAGPDVEDTDATTIGVHAPRAILREVMNDGWNGVNGEIGDNTIRRIESEPVFEQAARYYASESYLFYQAWFYAEHFPPTDHLAIWYGAYPSYTGHGAHSRMKRGPLVHAVVSSTRCVDLPRTAHDEASCPTLS